MRRNRPIFVKMNGVMLMLLVPVVILFAYFNRTSLRVIDTQITAQNTSQLQFLKQQIEANAERLSLSSSVLIRDSSVLELQTSMLRGDYYAMINTERQVKEKLYMQSFSSSWSNHLSIYWPTVGHRVSTNLGDSYDQELLDRSENGKWEFRQTNPLEEPYYQLFIWDPYFSKSTPQTASAVYEVRFGLDNIRRMLQQYQSEAAGQSFLLTKGGAAVSGTAAGDAMFADVGRKLLQEELGDSGHRNMELDNRKAYLSYVHLPTLDAYLFHYVPLNVIHAPIMKARNLFYLSLAVLILLAFAVAYLLYLHVQKPISAIVKGLKQYEGGNYSFRIRKKFHNEFDYMMLRFNDLGTEIQHLIHHVYEEQNRSRLATLKQLQSQINPHFLYNSLSFIAACAKAGETDTIRRMAYHLADYYRYTTRVENQLPLLREELELVTHYLNIYALRLERLDYRIEVPPDMLAEPIMRLILQPVVENAIEHGIEPKPGRGTIRISGLREAGWNLLVVEDSGAGLEEGALRGLMEGLERPMDADTGCGLWNVHQRLFSRFGPGAGITLDKSEELGGLRVALRWKPKKEEDYNDPIAAGG
ncbi:histidine kinase [Paenibacillus sp. YN15]|uniref:sensor histidine kinase n=1 Tax=Paenibacillus sp. YN15 TaxID=1742774 RepID=UPI000DCEAD4E|nr:histidine kinase [Paenibacillus sp. YN15]RAV01019.1 two-component sensor histidine kinase [Paenibacillus sp. YN15]